MVGVMKSGKIHLKLASSRHPHSGTQDLDTGMTWPSEVTYLTPWHCGICVQHDAHATLSYCWMRKPTKKMHDLKTWLYIVSTSFLPAIVTLHTTYQGTHVVLYYPAQTFFCPWM
jgi:hypothetical protein